MRLAGRERRPSPAAGSGCHLCRCSQEVEEKQDLIPDTKAEKAGGEKTRVRPAALATPCGVPPFVSPSGDRGARRVTPRISLMPKTNAPVKVHQKHSPCKGAGAVSRIEQRRFKPGGPRIWGSNLLKHSTPPENAGRRAGRERLPPPWARGTQAQGRLRARRPRTRRAPVPQLVHASWSPACTLSYRKAHLAQAA